MSGLTHFKKELIVKQLCKQSGHEADLIDKQEIDSSLTYQEAKRETFDKFLCSDAAPYPQDYIDVIEARQQQTYKKFIGKHKKRNTQRPWLDMAQLFKDVRATKPSYKKVCYYKRLSLKPLKKNEGYSIGRVLRLCADIAQTSLYSSSSERA